MYKTYNTIYLTIISPIHIIIVIFATKLKKNNIFIINNIFTMHYNIYIKLILKQKKLAN